MNTESKCIIPAATANKNNPAKTPRVRIRIRRQFDPAQHLKHHPSVLLGYENADSFEFVRQFVNDEFNPSTDYQQFLSESAAANIWRSLRSSGLESAALDTEIADQATAVDRKYEGIDNECRTYLALRSPKMASTKRRIRDDETTYTRRHFQFTKELRACKQ